MKPDGTPLASSIDLHAATTFIDATPIPTGAGGQLTVRVDPHGALTGQLTIAVYDIASDAIGSLALATTPPAQAQATVTTTTPGQNGVARLQRRPPASASSSRSRPPPTPRGTSRCGTAAARRSRARASARPAASSTRRPSRRPARYSVFLDPQAGADRQRDRDRLRRRRPTSARVAVDAGGLARRRPGLRDDLDAGPDATFRFTLASSGAARRSRSAAPSSRPARCSSSTTAATPSAARSPSARPAPSATR